MARKKWPLGLVMASALMAGACSGTSDDSYGGFPQAVATPDMSHQGRPVTAAEAYAAVDATLERLGLDLAMTSDPATFSAVLREDMLLHDFEPAQTLFARELETPTDLGAMLRRIRDAIATKQPAVAEFLVRALDEGLVEKVDDPKALAVLRRSVHFTYILDGLTRKIVEDISFAAAIQKHLVAKRAGLGIRGDLVGALEDLKRIYGGRMFEPTKFVGVDLNFARRLKTRKEGVITDAEVTAQNKSLTLNIVEAAVTENSAGFPDNAMAGVALSQLPAKTITLKGPNRSYDYEHSRAWASLYESWNLAFVTGNVSHLHLTYPKLLAPLVIDADSRDYLFQRSTALWMATFFHQFANLQKKPDVPLAKRREMALLWGKVNLRYGQELFRAEAGRNLDEAKGVLRVTLRELMEEMKKALTSIPLTPEESERLKKLYEDAP